MLIITGVSDSFDTVQGGQCSLRVRCGHEEVLVAIARSTYQVLRELMQQDQELQASTLTVPAPFPAPVPAPVPTPDQTALGPTPFSRPRSPGTVAPRMPRPDPRGPNPIEGPSVVTSAPLETELDLEQMLHSVEARLARGEISPDEVEAVLQQSGLSMAEDPDPVFDVETEEADPGEGATPLSQIFTGASPAMLRKHWGKQA